MSDSARGTAWIRTALSALALATLSLGVACSDRGASNRAPTEPVLDTTSTLVVVSAPSVPSVMSSRIGMTRTSLAPTGLAATVASGALAYVSLSPNSVASGVQATIRNNATGASATTPMADGGFDPVAIAAGVGDELSVEIQGPTGTLLKATVKVPRRRPPLLVRADPPNGKTDVPLNSRILVVFSEPVDPSTIPTSIQLFQGDQLVPGAVATLEAPGTAAIVNLTTALAPSTEYTLVVTTGVRDLAGDALPAASRISFTTAAAAPLPEGRIAFISDRDGTAQLYVVHTDGSALVRLTHDTLTYDTPAWSPDGSRIAVSQLGHGLVVMNADGSNPQLVSSASGNPTWAADGTWIRVGGWNVQDVRADGSEAKPVCTLTVSPSDLTPVLGPVDNVGSGGTAIAWSPDGHRVVFTIFADVGGDGFTQLYQSDDRCSTPRRLTSPQASTQSAESAPAWSPDGRRVAFWSFSAGISIVDPTAPGNILTVVPQPPNFAFNFWTALSWSPDGNFIAYANSTPREILVVGSSGGDAPRRVGAGGLAGWAPAWAPR